jgi:hypothetical protein
VKTTLFAATLVLALSLSAAAQKPPMSHHLAGGLVENPKPAPATPPILCDPCLFYGGDFDPSNINAAGLSDENTLLIGGSATYGNFNITVPVSVTVTGVLIQVQADANFDPLTAAYDIRSGVSEGNGGTSLASGTANTQVAATGRNFFGFNEYTVAVQLAAPLVISTGSYWFNVTPNCTNGSQDGSCSVGRFFVSNVTGNINGIKAGAEGSKEIFFNSPFFGFSWANWCDSSLGLNGLQCNRLSFGIMGTINK